MFSDTVDGAKASAVIYSLMLTCRACGVEPLSWLRHVLTELPQRDEDAHIGDLLSFNSSKTTTALEDLMNRSGTSGSQKRQKPR
ncbi:transposase domain-containing protein, partial [Neorhizobium galegae]|uniref:transposase domain-containing protein n=1 Tax=Neorhizobium galegae TaxID=399 RepID=UPI00210569B0